MAKGAKKTDAVSPQAAGAYPAQTIAQLLMMSVVRLNQLERDGWIQKAARNQYSLVQAVQGYIRFLKDDQKRSSKTAVQSRAQEARAKEIELRIAREEKTIIDTAEAIAAVDDVVGGIRADLAGLAARVTRDIALRQKIEREIDGILTAAADRFEQRASDLRTRGEVAAPDAEDDA